MTNNVVLVINMLAPFFSYLLECTNSNDFSGKIGESIIFTQQALRIPTIRPVVTHEYVTVSSLPFGIVEKSNERRFTGTIISLKCESVAEYPFPAKIKLVSGENITVIWNDIMGVQFNAVLDPEDEIRIDVLKDRSPEAIVLREAEKIFRLKEQLMVIEKEHTKKHKHHTLTTRRLAREMSRLGISNVLIDNQVFFCDGLYLIDYSDESEEFEVVNDEGVFIAKFLADDRGFSRLLSAIKKLESRYDPEEHITRITGIGA